MGKLLLVVIFVFAVAVLIGAFRNCLAIFVAAGELLFNPESVVEVDESRRRACPEPGKMRDKLSINARLTHSVSTGAFAYRAFAGVGRLPLLPSSS